MRAFHLNAIAVALGLAMSAGAADAATISGTYSVIGSNFASTVKSPFASITESFNISFSNTSAVSQQTAGISLNSSTITPASTLAYTYIPGVDTLIVGGTAATVASSDPNSTDFALVISNASNLSGFGITSLTYSAGQGAVFAAQTTAHAPAPTATPEPASIALLGTTFAAIGLMRRRQSK